MLTKVRFAIALVMGGAASSFCWLAGICLLSSAKADDTLGVAIGLYFIGKGFFVGPMLLITAWPRTPERTVPQPWE